MRKQLSLITTIMIIAGCANPKISNLQKGKYRYERNDLMANALSVKVGVLPITLTETVATPPISFVDMRDSLPHIFLKVLGGKIAHPDTFLSRLSRPILVPASKSALKSRQTDYTLHTVQFVFGSVKKYYLDERLMHPNTRMDFLNTRLTIDAASAAKIYNINRLQNEFDDIDLGVLIRDQTVAIGTTIGADGSFGGDFQNTSSGKSTVAQNRERSKINSVYDADGNLIGELTNGTLVNKTGEQNNSKTASGSAKLNGKVEASYQNTETIKEAVAIKLRKLRTGFNFAEKELTVSQRGRPSGDISDNVYVTATLKISNPKVVTPIHVYAFDSLFLSSYLPGLAEKVSAYSRLINYVSCADASNIKFSANYDAAIRAVRNVGKAGTNALEYDDKVKNFVLANISAGQFEIDKNAFCKDAWNYWAVINNDSLVLRIEEKGRSIILSVFEDDNPEAFLNWLETRLSAPSTASLKAGKFQLYFENPNNRSQQVWVVKNNITQNDVNALQGIKSLFRRVRKR